MLTLQQTVKVCQSWDRNKHCQITGLQFLITPHEYTPYLKL